MCVPISISKPCMPIIFPIINVFTGTAILYYIILGNSYLKFFFQFLPLNFLVYEIRSQTRPRISKLWPMKQIWSPTCFYK